LKASTNSLSLCWQLWLQHISREWLCNRYQRKMESEAPKTQYCSLLARWFVARLIFDTDDGGDSSSETLHHIRTIRCYIPENGNFRIYRCVNLKSYTNNHGFVFGTMFRLHSQQPRWRSCRIMKASVMRLPFSVNKTTLSKTCYKPWNVRMIVNHELEKLRKLLCCTDGENHDKSLPT
jgi:hypothetical protein